MNQNSYPSPKSGSDSANQPAEGVRQASQSGLGGSAGWQEAARQWVRIERQLQEALDRLWDDYVDPDEVLYDEAGMRWARLSDMPRPGSPTGAAYTTEAQLANIRAECRALAVGNEFAINGHENRISYIVGPGHKYRIVPKPGRRVPAEILAQYEEFLVEFLRINKWHHRQQEIVRRKDRDGEVFLRFFVGPDGMTRVRFVEPEQVSTPATHSANPAASFGILTDPQDVETVLGYFIDGQFVEASLIQHRKLGVDANVKRGLPLFYPVRANLRRAEKLLRNMSVLAEVQSAIALIRKHTTATRSALEQFIRQEAEGQSGSGLRATPLRRYGPGTILDVFAGVEYDFPASRINAANYVAVLQAELRAIAARLVMPEFMLTSDASNANYASTMVAEGPAVKMFERLQQDMIADDLEVLWFALRTAVAAGRLPGQAMEDIEIQAVPPSLCARDRLREAQADRILVLSGAMSPRTMALRHGLDPDREAASGPNGLLGQNRSQESVFPSAGGLPGRIPPGATTSEAAG
ncbi:MAG: phage portal protein [Thermoguttaceae bacterium]|nr:phage portal protein [Thermoguttaceae bacterium]MDW8039619.1 phage portal protein [Thermoguttaceae bacterium]